MAPERPEFGLPAKTAVLASGGGRTFQNLVELARSGELPIEVELLIVDRHEAGALDRAETLGIDALYEPWSRERGSADWSRAVFESLEARGIELVLLGGFLRLLHVPSTFSGRVLNIHPSLLPAFGGKGFYGDHVHRAVLERGVQFTGCTVHLVDARYDEGPILVQRTVPVERTDDVATLAARVFDAECVAYPEAIRQWIAPGD